MKNLEQLCREHLELQEEISRLYKAQQDIERQMVNFCEHEGAYIVAPVLHKTTYVVRSGGLFISSVQVAVGGA